MAVHKLKVGQKVLLRYATSQALRPPAGAEYQIVSLLPHDGGHFTYRVKSAAEKHERVAAEDQLTPC